MIQLIHGLITYGAEKERRLERKREEKEPYKRDNILRKRPIILSILLTVTTPYGVSRGLN